MTSYAGKNAEGPKKFKGTGGHTSRGNVPPAGSAAGSTSKANNRTGTLTKRLKGADGRVGMPK